MEILNLFFPWILLRSPKCHSKFPCPGSHSWLEPKHHLHPSTSVIFDYVPWSAAKLSLLLTMKTLTFNWIYFLSHCLSSLPGPVLPPAKHLLLQNCYFWLQPGIPASPKHHHAPILLLRCGKRFQGSKNWFFDPINPHLKLPISLRVHKLLVQCCHWAELQFSLTLINTINHTDNSFSLNIILLKTFKKPQKTHPNHPNYSFKNSVCWDKVYFGKKTWGLSNLLCKSPTEEAQGMMEKLLPVNDVECAGEKHRLVGNRTCTSHGDILQTERHHRSLLALSTELIMGGIYCPKRIVSSAESDKQNYLKPCGNSSTCSSRTGWTPECQMFFTDTFKLNVCELCFWSCYNFCSFTKIWAVKVSFLPQFTKFKQLLKRTERLTELHLWECQQ